MTWERIDYCPCCDGHFLDGYLPDKRELNKSQQRYRHLKDTATGFGLADGGDQDGDNAFLDLVDALARDRMSDLRHPPDPWSITIVKLKPPETPQSCPYPAIVAEFAADPAVNRRGLMLLSGPWNGTDGYVDSLVGEAGFTLKSQSEYAEYAGFRKDCHSMLCDSLDILVTPLQVIERRLAACGLDSLRAVE